MRGLLWSLGLLLGCGASPHKPMRLYLEAGMRAQEGDLSGAAALYEASAEADPEALKPRLAAARAHARLRDWKGALKALKAAEELAPEAAEVLQLKGELLLSTQQFGEARRLFESYTQRWPESPVGWAGQASVATREGAVDVAESAQIQLCRLQPARAEHWIRLADLRERLQALLPAAQALEEATHLLPEHGNLDQRIIALALRGGDQEMARRAAQRFTGHPLKASMLLASLLFNRGQLFEADLELERLSLHYPTFHPAHLLRAQVLARADQNSAALRELEQIPPESSLSKEAKQLRVLLSMATEDLPKALRGVRALRASEDIPRWVHLEARVLLNAGRNEDAFQLLKESSERWPKETPLIFLKGIAAQAEGDKEGALQSMHDVLTLEPQHPGALNFLGYVWAEQGIRLDEAEAMIRSALRQRPDDPNITDSLGWLMFRRGELGSAQRLLRRAFRMAPERAEIVGHLAEVLWSTGEKGRARRLFQRAIQLAGDKKSRTRFQQRLSTLEGEK